MDNYVLSRENARKYFLLQDQAAIAARPGVTADPETFTFSFLGEPVYLCRKTGEIRFADGHPADFSEALTVYDWLCSRQDGAAAAEEYCPIHGLPGVVVRGSGLSMTGGTLPDLIDRAPEAFSAACEAMGGTPLPMGDLCWKVPLFSDLNAVLKFYHGDEDFPASLTPLWDRNILRFIKYETVYYAADCLFQKLRRSMAQF